MTFFPFLMPFLVDLLGFAQLYKAYPAALRGFQDTVIAGCRHAVICTRNATTGR